MTDSNCRMFAVCLSPIPVAPSSTLTSLQLTCRIVVWESDEPEMKAMLREGADPYTEIARNSTMTQKSRKGSTPPDVQELCPRHKLPRLYSRASPDDWVSLYANRADTKRGISVVSLASRSGKMTLKTKWLNGAWYRMSLVIAATFRPNQKVRYLTKLRPGYRNLQSRASSIARMLQSTPSFPMSKSSSRSTIP